MASIRRVNWELLNFCIYNLRKKKNRYASTIYKLAITNTIGISFIDSHPREIIHITITNLNFTQTILNETVQKGENDGYYMDEMQEATQWERQNVSEVWGIPYNILDVVYN